MRVIERKILLSLGRALGQELDFKKLLDYLITELVKSIPSSSTGQIFLYNRNRRQLVAEASYGYTGSIAGYNLNAGEGLPGRCLSQRKSFLLPTAEAVEETTNTLRPTNLGIYSGIRYGQPPVISAVAVPLINRKKILGVIVLEQINPNCDPFTEADLFYLESISSWIWLIIDHAQLNLELRDNKRSYRELLGKFIASGEQLRKEIAREIHDEINQLLLSVRLDLEDVENTLSPNQAKSKEKLHIVQSHINLAFDNLQNLSLSLRPPALDEMGLNQALDWYIRKLSKESGLYITLDVKGATDRRPAPVIETELFRIAQEALTNTIKHARATSVKVKLEFDEHQVALIIEDNGKGFDASTMFGISGSTINLGLLGMRERAEICGGTLDIESIIGRGTLIRIIIPISSYDWGIY